jgi:hypothetical protein
VRPFCAPVRSIVAGLEGNQGLKIRVFRWCLGLIMPRSRVLIKLLLIDTLAQLAYVSDWHP